MLRLEFVITVTGVAVGVVRICGIFRVAPTVTDGRSLGLGRESGEGGDKTLKLSFGLDLRFVRRALAGS